MIIGIDEVGLGPIAGPVVVAAVLIKDGVVADVRDSKKMAEQKRYDRADEIVQKAEWYAIARRDPAEINRRGLGKCHQECLKEVAQTAHDKYPSAEIIIDGAKNAALLQWGGEFLQFQVDGDDLIYQISAASLVAKAYRDRSMIALAKKFPDYGFERHKGYPTKEHVEMLERWGLTEHHRTRSANKALRSRLLDKSDGGLEEAYYSIEEAHKYVKHANSMFDVLDDWSKGFIKSIRSNLDLKLDLTPRQKFFLKRLVTRARQKKRKKEKSRLSKGK
jgi:ribonuclease HII